MSLPKFIANSLIERLKKSISVDIPHPAFKENNSFVLLFNDRLPTRFLVDEPQDKLYLTSFLSKMPSNLSDCKTLYRFLLTANFKDCNTNHSTFGLEMDEEGDESIVYASYFKLSDTPKIEDEFVDYLEKFLTITEYWQETFLTGETPRKEKGKIDSLLVL